MSLDKGYRGYVSSRPFGGERVPQHVQNIVIRDYCGRKGIVYELSATEYAMPYSFIVLEQVIEDLPNLGGIVFYSLLQLSPNYKQRRKLFDRVISNQRTLHFAVEGLQISDLRTSERVEQIFAVQLVMPICAASADIGMI
jgi:sporadic carbohydrate cluster protein (TIGR04323 family)